jgi:hypothetical protein
MPSLGSSFDIIYAQELTMKSISISLALVAAALLAAPPALFAQETKTARGAVASVAEDSLTLKMAGREMKFAVDAKTAVEVVGGGTASRQAQQAGQPGPKLTEVLKPGQPVTITYTEANGVMRAATIRAITSPGARAGAGAAPGGAKTMTINGTVTSITPTSMIVTGSGASSTFTLAIDGSTKVVATGAGTTAAAAGGKTAVTDLVSKGDRVSVSCHQTGGSLHAVEIRVAAKAAAK